MVSGGEDVRPRLGTGVSVVWAPRQHAEGLQASVLIKILSNVIVLGSFFVCLFVLFCFLFVLFCFWYLRHAKTLILLNEKSAKRKENKKEQRKTAMCGAFS